MIFLRLISFTESDKVRVDSDLWNTDLWNNSHVPATSCFSCCSSVSKLPSIPGLVFFFLTNDVTFPLRLSSYILISVPQTSCVQQTGSLTFVISA